MRDFVLQTKALFSCKHLSSLLTLLTRIFPIYLFIISVYQVQHNEQEKKQDTGFTRINCLSKTYHASIGLCIAQNKNMNKNITNCSNKTFTEI